MKNYRTKYSLRYKNAVCDFLVNYKFQTVFISLYFSITGIFGQKAQTADSLNIQLPQKKLKHNSDFKLAGITYFNYPTAHNHSPNINQKSTVQETAFFFNIPTQLKNKKTILMNGVSYSLLDTKNHNQISSFTNYRTLQTISYSFTVVHRWTPEWVFIGNIRPTIASDFEADLSKDDFTLQASAMATKTLNNHWDIGGGLSYTNRFGEPMVIPMFLASYSKNRHELQAILPAKIAYAYQIDNAERLKVGAKVAVNGGYFNITSKTYESTPELPPINKINYSRAISGVVINYRLFDMVQLDVFGGYTTFRRFQAIDFDEEIYQFDVDNGPFLNISLSIVPPIKRKK